MKRLVLLAVFAALVIPQGITAGNGSNRYTPVSYSVLVKGPAVATAGGTSTWRIQVRNTGSNDIHSTQVQYWLSNGAKLKPGTTKGFKFVHKNPNDQAAIWSLGTLKSGKTATVVVRSTPPPRSLWALKTYCPEVSLFGNGTLQKPFVIYKCAKYVGNST